MSFQEHATKQMTAVLTSNHSQILGKAGVYQTLNRTDNKYLFGSNITSPGSTDSISHGEQRDVETTC